VNGVARRGVIVVPIGTRVPPVGVWSTIVPAVAALSTVVYGADARTSPPPSRSRRAATGVWPRRSGTSTVTGVAVASATALPLSTVVPASGLDASTVPAGAGSSRVVDAAASTVKPTAASADAAAACGMPASSGTTT